MATEGKQTNLDRLVIDIQAEADSLMKGTLWLVCCVNINVFLEKRKSEQGASKPQCIIPLFIKCQTDKRICPNV